MNPRTFLKRFEESADHERLTWLVYDEMREFCKKEGITIDDISHEEMEELAEAFVQRGFGVPASDETARARTEWELSND